MAEKVSPVNIIKVGVDSGKHDKDIVVVEEPLEIRVGYGPEENRHQATISVTMRTPGDDEHLCLGFLFTEGIVDSTSRVLSAKYCNNSFEEDGGENVMRVELSPEFGVEPANFRRNFFVNSSCGVCGKATIDHLKTESKPVGQHEFRINTELLIDLPQKLEASQDVFRHTGGLHACGLFDAKGSLLVHKEDVGRHNALDKLIGSLFIKGDVPAIQTILMLSGRISFELVQKAVKAGIPIIIAVGAPSSLAISVAEEFGVTLVGFLREKRFNIYTHQNRIATK